MLVLVVAGVIAVMVVAAIVLDPVLKALSEVPGAMRADRQARAEHAVSQRQRESEQAATEARETRRQESRQRGESDDDFRMHEQYLKVTDELSRGRALLPDGVLAIADWHCRTAHRRVEDGELTDDEYWIHYYRPEVIGLGGTDALFTHRYPRRLALARREVQQRLADTIARAIHSLNDSAG